MPRSYCDSTLHRAEGETIRYRIMKPIERYLPSVYIKDFTDKKLALIKSNISLLRQLHVGNFYVLTKYF